MRQTGVIHGRFQVLSNDHLCYLLAGKARCCHLIVGRDHAGVGDYYGPFDAQKIFEDIPAGDLHIEPLNIDWTFWCHKCDGMASMKTCPHGKEDRVLISGTKVREMLSAGEMPPKEFSRPEVAQILVDYYANL